MSERRGRPFFRAAITLGFFVLLIVGASQVLYRDRVLPGVTVAGINLGGKTESEAAATIADRTKDLKRLTFAEDGRSYEFSAAELSLKADPQATARLAMEAGRGDFGIALAPSSFGFGTYDSRLVYRLNRSALKQKLLDRTAESTRPAIDASVVRAGDDFEGLPEADGFGIDADRAVRDASLAIERLETAVTLHRTVLRPRVTSQDLAAPLAQARLLADQPAVIQAGDREFLPGPVAVRDWVGFRVTKQSAKTPLYDSTIVPMFLKELYLTPAELGEERFRLTADYDRESVGQYVNTIADQMDRPAENGRLTMRGGKLVFSGESKDGQVVDRPAAVDEIVSRTKRAEVAVLRVVKEPAQISPTNLGKLGLKTLIGSATTTFGGSPVNRTFNIGVGAARFDGVLIKPGQEFSFNTTLGEVGPETGYRQELVILENKTAPQYGGGLCQVSTTMFRAAMDAGLPITDRTNHSYAVHYYAPIGMDATIYPPDPDMKFVNNTKGYILVQTSQSGQSLTYEFYGTDDGRKSSTEILSINATEEGGGTASFRYSVKGGPQPIDQVFYSSYKPRKAFPVAGEQSLN
ncbi:MAG: VanW family protein [bacterium]|nr:VanW family protein [bacterium]MDZ4248181.1 VanW family protein [Patescibacteria group bacterium]